MSANARCIALGVSAVFLMSSGARAGTVRFVDDDAPLGGDGLSWNTSYRFLQDALAEAAEPESGIAEIHVGQGTYQPDRDAANPMGTGDRLVTFELTSDVAIRGGFAGFGAPDPDLRDIAAFQTILSGDLAGDDGPDFANNGENSFHVVTSIGTDDTAVLEGVTIQGGNANGTTAAVTALPPSASGELVLARAQLEGAPGGPSLCNGGGLINFDGSPLLLDVSFVANFAEELGGGMETRGISEPTLQGCAFSGNRAGSDGAADGGGFWIHGGGAAVLDCSFTGNVATNTAGGMGMLDNGPLPVTIAASAFMGNMATGPSTGASGGGALAIFDRDALIVDCLFTDNAALNEPGRFASGGAVVLDDEFRPILIDCVFKGNVAGDTGGALFTQLGSQAAVFDCTFIDNTAGAEGGAFRNNSSEPDFVNCLFVGNSAALGGAISNGGDMFLVSCTLTDNIAENGGAINNAGNFLTEPLTARNTIIYGNSPNEIVDDPEQPSTVTYSDVLGGFTGIGNIDADPAFVDPDGPDDDPLTFGDNDYRLSAGSPCIDAADNLAVPADEADLDGDSDTAEPVPVDLDGNPRFLEIPETPDSGNGGLPIVDMGAFEALGGGCLAITIQEVICHADGTTFTVNIEGLNNCTGGASTVSITASGGTPGEELCTTVLVNDAETGGLCCSTEVCVPIPDCSQPACPCDLDGDGMVQGADLLALLAAWAAEISGPPDFDGDGTVGTTDFLELLANWGPCP